MTDDSGHDPIDDPSPNPLGDETQLSPDMEKIVTATEELPEQESNAVKPVKEIRYQLEHLAMVESSHGEEIEMIHASAVEPVIEPGPELLGSIDTIPNKMAFKIGEAAEMVGVKQYVLRYWETEFEMLRPRKSKNNQRVYGRRDVETAMMIKKLLYDDRFSIEGARAALKSLRTQVKEDRGVKRMAESQETAVHKLRGLVSEIRRIRDLFL